MKTETTVFVNIILKHLLGQDMKILLKVVEERSRTNTVLEDR